MIPYTHLRIGNVVQVDGILFRVKAAHLLLAEQGDGMVPADPVPITREILLMCGYQEIDDKGFWENPLFAHQVCYDPRWTNVLFCSGDLFAKTAYSLHELQNMAFVLDTGDYDELPIVLPHEKPDFSES